MSPADSTALKVVQDAPNYRSVPHNDGVEQQLLGAIFINREAFDAVSSFLLPKHFFVPVHQLIFDVVGQFVRMNKTPTPVSIRTFLPEDLKVDGRNVSEYLAHLAAEATTIINAADFGHTIYDLSMRRDLISIGTEVVNVAYEAPVELTAKDQIEEAEKHLFELAESGKSEGGFRPFAGALARAIDMAGAAFQREGHLSGLATGLKDLDHKLGGLQKSDLVILAGRPGMGKTALATNIAYNVAKSWQGNYLPNGHFETTKGGVTAFFSLEMSAEQLATRILAEQTEISSSRIRRGDIKQIDFDKLVDKTTEIQQLPLLIDDTGGLSVAQLATRARRLKRQRGLDLLVIDYIQLLSGSTRRSAENRVQEITEITTKLKGLAKELDIPILALSQLSRQVESREDKRPQLSDLRESGSIEQDADVVMFVYREEYYLAGREPRPGTDEHAKWHTQMEQAHNKAEVIIGKQRHGPTGPVIMQFDAELTRFSDLAIQDPSPPSLPNYN